MISGVHDGDDQPSNSPMFTGGLQKQQKESLTDAFASAATAIAKALSPKQSQSDTTVMSDVTATTQTVSQHSQHRQESGYSDEEFGATACLTKLDGRWDFEPS